MIDLCHLQIELRLVAGLLPYARNSRTHSAEQVAQVAASIVEFGWTNPILVDGDGGVLAGHARILASRKLGIEEVQRRPSTGSVTASRSARLTAM